MNPSHHFQLRDLIPADIDLVANYWLNSDEAHLLTMGVDLCKLPSRHQITEMLTTQLHQPDEEKSSLALIACVDNVPVGHCNVNNISYGYEATMHLHLWHGQNRKKGLGTTMVRAALPVFFERLNLHTLWCEPYAKNPAPNRTLEKVGFEFVKTYVTIPGSLNFEQEVNRWKMSKERFGIVSREG